MVNCTVVGNRVTDHQFAGGLLLEGTFGTLEISNTIIWGNSTAAGDSGELTQLWNPNLPSFLVLKHTTVQGFTGTRFFEGSGNTGVDPEFVDQLGPDTIDALVTTVPTVSVAMSAKKVSSASMTASPPTRIEKLPDVSPGGMLSVPPLAS